MATLQFPPTVWQYQDWSVSVWSFILGVILVFAMVVLLGTRRSPSRFYLSALLVALFGLIFVIAGQASTQGGMRADLVTVTLNLLVVVVGMVGVARNWTSAWKHFSPFEGIAVVVIVLLGWSLFLPAGGTPRESSWRTQCKNNLKQMGLAIHNYHDEHSMLPLAVSGQPEQSWRTNLLPYLDMRSMHDRYDFDSAWNSEANQFVSREIVRPYHCPQRPAGRNRNSSGQFLTSYIAPSGPDTILSKQTASRFRDITDGLSNTLMVLEACGSEIVWTEPRDLPVTSQSISVNSAGDRIDYSTSLLSSYHTGGAQVLLGDGSARFVSENIDAKILKALLTKSGGETTEEW